MKFLSLVMLTLAILGCSTHPPSSADGAWEQQIRAAEERHRIAFLTNDLGALDAMFSDDFIVNSPQNRVIEKGTLLGMVRGGVLAISSFDQKIESIRRYGDVVTVMGEDRVVYAAPSPTPARRIEEDSPISGSFEARAGALSRGRPSITTP